MYKGTWWATVHGVTRVGHDLVTKPPPPITTYYLWANTISMSEVLHLKTKGKNVDKGKKWFYLIEVFLYHLSTCVCLKMKTNLM